MKDARPASLSRREERTLAGHRLVLVDSITQVAPGDAGHVVISGSHGGTSAAAFAVAVPAALYVFNDAGIGKEDAGIAGLVMLDRHCIAACAVGHGSARIGEAADTLDSGIVSAVNRSAARLGLVAGRPIRDQLVAVLTRLKGGV